MKYPFVTNYTCASDLLPGIRMPSVTLITRTKRYFRSPQGVNVAVDPDVLWHVQEIEDRGPESTVLHLTNGAIRKEDRVSFEAPMSEFNDWQNVCLN